MKFNADPYMLMKVADMIDADEIVANTGMLNGVEFRVRVKQSWVVRKVDVQEIEMSRDRGEALGRILSDMADMARADSRMQTRFEFADDGPFEVELRPGIPVSLTEEPEEKKTRFERIAEEMTK